MNDTVKPKTSNAIKNISDGSVFFNHLRQRYLNTKKYIVSYKRLLGMAFAALAAAGSYYEIKGGVEKDFSPLPVIDELIGEWDSQYSYTTSFGKNTLNITTEFFDNGSYNVRGMHSVYIAKDNKEFELKHELSGAGSWSSNGETLITNLNSLKTNPIVFTLNQKAVDSKIFPKKLIPRLEDKMANGTAIKYSILNIENGKAVLATKGPQGNCFQITMTKNGI